MACWKRSTPAKLLVAVRRHPACVGVACDPVRPSWRTIRPRWLGRHCHGAASQRRPWTVEGGERGRPGDLPRRARRRGWPSTHGHRGIFRCRRPGPCRVIAPQAAVRERGRRHTEACPEARPEASTDEALSGLDGDDRGAAGRTDDGDASHNGFFGGGICIVAANDEVHPSVGQDEVACRQRGWMFPSMLRYMGGRAGHRWFPRIDASEMSGYKRKGPAIARRPFQNLAPEVGLEPTTP